MQEATKVSAQTNEVDDDLDLDFYGEAKDNEDEKQAVENDDTAVAGGDVKQEQTDADKKDDAQAETETVKPTETGESEQPQKQSAEENSEFARRRREAERQKEIEKARVDTIIEVVGINPYTQKELKDAEDVAQYLLMKKIEKDGGDPVADFPEYAKRQNNERAAAEKAEADRKLSQAEDIKNFKAKYPKVDLQELAKDTDFDEFCDGKLGVKPLTEIYEQYVSFKDRLASRYAKKAEEEAVAKQAKSTAAVGSLASTDEAKSEYYTLEELRNLSDEEAEANLEKVHKSMARLGLRK